MRTNKHDTLNGGTVRRLNAMRAYVRKWNEDPDKRARKVKRINWKHARSHGIGTIGGYAHGPTFNKLPGRLGREYANIPTSVLAGLRDVGNADEITRDDNDDDYIGRPLVSHRGWFADAHQDEIYRGHVWQLPARDGSRLYLAGYSESESGYSVLCARGNKLELFDSLRDAIYAADHIAERMAEDAREYSERWQEASACADEIADLKSEAKGARENWRAFMDTLRAGVHKAHMRKLADNARADHAQFIDEVIAKRARIAELKMEGEF
jgi:hypothetical protein